MKRSKEIAALVTLLFVFLMSIWLVNAKLHWNPSQPWPPDPEPYIELAVEEEETFVEPEPIPLPEKVPGDLAAPAKTEEPSHVDSKLAPETGTSIANVGKKATPAKEVTTKKESPVKITETKEKPKEQGPAVDTKKQAQEATAKKTNASVSNAFANASAKNNANNGKNDDGKSGRPDGQTNSAGPSNSNSVTAGIAHGTVGGGWQFPAYSNKIPSSVTGSVKLSLTIDKNGNVTSAKVIGGNAPAGSNATVQARCIAEAKSKRFTRTGGEAPDEATAILTFIFK
jgi:outer membrane biosynthesis protein TonB